MVLDKNPTQHDRPDMRLVLTAMEWKDLHQRVYQMMTQWANRQNRNHLAMAWRTAVRDGLTENSTWQEAQRLLLTDTFMEYSCYLTACQDLTQSVRIYVDPEIYVLSYQYTEQQGINYTCMPTISTENTPKTSKNLSKPQPVIVTI